MIFALASVALAAQSTLAVNFKSYVNSKSKYSPSSAGKLEFTATACVYATQDSTTPLTGYAYDQECRFTSYIDLWPHAIFIAFGLLPICQNCLALPNYLLAVILPKIPDMCLRTRCLNHACKPRIGLILCHNIGQVQSVE